MSLIQIVYDTEIDSAFHKIVMEHFRQGGPVLHAKHIEEIKEQERIRFTNITTTTDATGRLTTVVALGEDGRIYSNPPINQYLEKK